MSGENNPMESKNVKTEKLFVYGTLRFPRFQKEAFGRVVLGQKVVAVGYKRSQRIIGGESYPIMFESANSKVKGLLFLLTPKELADTDRYEDSIYRRQKITLQAGSSAWAYVYIVPEKN